MMPSQQNEQANSLVAKQLCSLREHATLKSLGVYTTSHQTTPTSSSLRPARDRSHDSSKGTNDKAAHRRRPRSQRIASEPTILEPIEEASHLKPHLQPHPLGVSSEPDLTALVAGHATSSAASPTAALDAQYFEVAEASAHKLVAAADGRESEGWISVGTSKDITVMKKPAAKGEPPINSVKGVGLVKVPPTFIIRVLTDPSYTTILDDMLKESRIIQDLSKSLHLVQLLYKAIWPTAPREFSVLSILGELDERTWISSGISVNDPRIPEEKGYVRAQLDVGGYLIRSVPSEPEMSEVTYVARVDLKGKIPAFAVNKISESQPLCVNRLRGLVEPLYAKMKDDSQKLREFEEKFPIAMVVPPKTKPSLTLTEEKAHSSGREEHLEDTEESKEDTSISITQEGTKAETSSSGRGTSLVDATQTMLREGSKKEKIESISGVSEGNLTADNAGETAEIRQNGNHTSSTTQSSKETAAAEEEEDVESTVVISMSDLHPTDTLHIPSNAKLVPPNSDSLFSVGAEEEDQYSLHDSWTGELLETYTPEQLPSDPEEEAEREGGVKAGRKGSGSMDSANGGSVFINKPSPALQLKLPNYQRVRDSIASNDDPVEVRGQKVIPFQ